MPHFFGWRGANPAKKGRRIAVAGALRPAADFPAFSTVDAYG
jgi:hypothetical protein